MNEWTNFLHMCFFGYHPLWGCCLKGGGRDIGGGGGGGGIGRGRGGSGGEEEVVQEEEKEMEVEERQLE